MLNQIRDIYGKIIVGKVGNRILDNYETGCMKSGETVSMIHTATGSMNLEATACTIRMEIGYMKYEATAFIIRQGIGLVRNTEMPACNKRLGASGGVTSNNVSWEIDRLWF